MTRADTFVLPKVAQRDRVYPLEIVALGAERVARDEMV